MSRAIKIITALLLWSSSAVFAQDSWDGAGGLKNEIGIDVANVLTFLSKKSDSYLLNYKRHFTDKYALRSALNLEWSTSKDGYKGIGACVGYEWQHPIVSRQWYFRWGVDASFNYRANNFQPNKSVRGGVHPLIGVSFFLVPQFSISTEAGLNFFYTDYSNPKSFDPADNKGYFDINIRSVGMLTVSYHF